MHWVYMYVAKQHYRCSEFNVEFVLRQPTECQRVQILRWVNSLLVNLSVAGKHCLGRRCTCCRPSRYMAIVQFSVIPRRHRHDELAARRTYTNSINSLTVDTQSFSGSWIMPSDSVGSSPSPSCSSQLLHVLQVISNAGLWCRPNDRLITAHW